MSTVGGRLGGIPRCAPRGADAMGPAIHRTWRCIACANVWRSRESEAGVRSPVMADQTRINGLR